MTYVCLTNIQGLTIARKLLPILFLLLSLNLSFGQLTVTGIVTDSTTKAPVDYLLVAVFHYKTEKIIAYEYTNPLGEYKLVLPYISGFFTLKARSLDYKEYTRDIFLTESGNKAIDLSFQVAPKNNTLKEVVVEIKRSPIIVKDDTIIYDIAHWTQTEDQNLEDVLRKIPSFEVLENGELKINGKPIGKVLIDGEEFLKGGAALSTRSIAPSMVKSIEVRLDESDSKLKESLLNSNKLVVLDIKLKEDINRLAFGKGRLTSGYQKQVNVGGYTNLFSLGKKQKYHFLGEYDAFGHQTISLSQIHNIGREAFQNVFNLPADFNRLTENPEFNKEIYGFKDYIQSKQGIAGLTTKYTLTKNLELFVGTYNSYAKEGIDSRTTQQFFESATNYQFNERKYNVNFNSKNKLDLQFNKDKIKANYNFNAVFSDKTFMAVNQNLTDSYRFNTDKTNGAQEYYHNILIEYLIDKRIGLHTKAFYGVSNRNGRFYLNHNQPLYAKYLYDDAGLSVLNFEQSTKEKRNEFVTDSRLQIQSKAGYFQVGFQYLAEQRDIAKTAYKNLTDENIRLNSSLFSGETPSLHYIKTIPYLSHRFRTGKAIINNKIGYANLSYPNLNFLYETKTLIEYDGSVQIDFNTEDSFNLSYSQKVSSYSILNIAQGYDLIDFQTFAIPQQSTPTPRIESVIQANIDKVINRLNTAIEAFALYSQSKTYNSYGLNSAPFISLMFDQLGGNYLLGGLKIATVFNNFPVNLKLEPSYVTNKNDNITNQGELYSTSTERRIIQLRVLSRFENKNFNFELKTKFSDFRFSSDLSIPSNQKMLSVGLTYKQDLFTKKVFFQSTFQNINFWGTSSAVNLNISGRLQYSVNSFNCFLEGDNLLDNQYFIKQSIAPSYFSDGRQNLFGRYVKFGFEYTFR